MKVKEMKCSNCGATISVQEGKSVQFCQFCGNQVIIEDGSTKTTNVNHRYIDEAEIRRIEADKERREQEEARKQKEEDERKATNKKLLFGWIASMVLIFIISLFTMDNVNFSPFHIILIIDIIVGIVIIKKRSNKD